MVVCQKWLPISVQPHLCYQPKIALYVNIGYPAQI